MSYPFHSLANSCLRFTIVVFGLLLFMTAQESIFPDIGSSNQYQQVYRELVKAENSKMIEQFNQDQAHGFKLSANKFISLKNDEFLSLYTTDVKSNHIQQVQINFNSAKGSSLSGGAKGISQQTQTKIKFEPSICTSVNIDLSIHATSVKDQGHCQSCYAYSTISTIETLMHIDFGLKFDLSEQHLVQCSLKWAPKGYEGANNKGCDGGWGWKAMSYIQNYGVTLEKDNPYTLGVNQNLKPCDEDAITTERFGIKGFKKFIDYIWPESQCNILDEVLQEGKTIAVSIYVPDGFEFQFYGSKTPDIDIWNICGHHKIVNHEMQLVGSTDRYWKLKNSFGLDWGQKGYIYLDKSKGLNCLNICMDFAYPTSIPSLTGQ